MPQTVGVFEDCMDWDECAEMIPCATSSLRAQYREWGVPNIRIAGKIYFIQGEVEAWLRKRAYAHRQHEERGAMMSRQVK